MVAVLTADLINSTSYNKPFLNEVITTLKIEFESISNEQDAYFSLFRGDSFQGVVKKPETALHIALQIKSAVLKVRDISEKKSNIPIADVRIAIGIGEADFNEKTIAESNGEAFQFSGNTLDTMKVENKKISLKTASQQVNDEFEVSLKFLDSLTSKWSVASAEVIYYLLKGMKEQQIANLLGRSQAAINLRKKAAGWEEVQLLLQRFNQVFSKS